MIPSIKTILYCTQLGPHALHIFKYAYALADSFGARIVVLHVQEVLKSSQEALVEGYSGQGSVHGVVEKTEHDAEVTLHQRIEAFFANEIGVDSWNGIIDRIIVAEGRAPKQITEHIRSVQADVVVMGAHRYGLMELLLGSTSAKVIAHSKVPVMVVPVPEGKPADR